MLKAVLLAALAVLSVVTTRQLVTQARAEFAFEYSGLRDQIAVAPDLDPAVADYARTLGDFWMTTSVPPQLERAAAAYRRAVELNPYEAFHWCNWAGVCRRLGRNDMAEKAFAVAESLDPQNYIIQREIGDFYLAQQQISLAALHHARAIQLQPALARSLYAVYWNLNVSPLDVARDLLGNSPKLLRQYVADCLAWVSPEEADRLWKGLQSVEGVFDASAFRAYFDFLIGNKKYNDARILWQQIARDFYRTDWDPQTNFLWNGSFSLPLTFEGGLEWRIAKSLPRGVQAVVSTGRGLEKSQCLWIHFDGSENVAFSHVRHSFFVQPGHVYLLRYRINALDLTTDNGLYVSVVLFGDKPSRYNGRVITGTGGWDLENRFYVPEGVEWGEIIICRDRSTKLNNRIKGDVWYDDFLLEIETEQTTGSLTK